MPKTIFSEKRYWDEDEFAIQHFFRFDESGKFIISDKTGVCLNRNGFRMAYLCDFNNEKQILEAKEKLNNDYKKFIENGN